MTEDSIPKSVVYEPCLDEVEGAWCPQCNRTVLAVCESSLIAGFVHDWVEDVEKCPLCQRTLSYRKTRTDKLRRLQRW